jgi:hypothetical protein
MAICVIVTLVMVATDEDTTSVSKLEWVMFAVIIYAAAQAIRRLTEIYKRGSWD